MRSPCLCSPSCPHRRFNPFPIKSDKEQKNKIKALLGRGGYLGERGGRRMQKRGKFLAVCNVLLRGIREKRAEEQRRGRKAFSNLPEKVLAQSRRRRFPLDTRNPIVEQSSGFSRQSLLSWLLFLSESLDPPASFP